MRIIFALAALLIGVSAASAQTPVRISGSYTPLGHCQITSLVSAVALVSASCSSGSVPTGATMAEICVEVASVRFLDDGTAPTTAVGILVAPQSSTLPTCYQYAIVPLTQVQFIAVSGSPVIDVAFYK